MAAAAGSGIAGARRDGHDQEAVWRQRFVRWAGVTLGLAGCVLGGAATGPLAPEALAAGHNTGWSIVPSVLGGGSRSTRPVLMPSPISSRPANQVGSGSRRRRRS